MIRILSSFLLVQLTACAGTSVMQLKVVPARPLDCKVDIFASDSEVPKKFETLCVVEAHTGAGWIHDKTASGALEQARPKLCECGADAAVLVDATSKQSSDWTTSIFTPIQDQRGNVKVRGIRYIP